MRSTSVHIQASVTAGPVATRSQTTHSASVGRVDPTGWSLQLSDKVNKVEDGTDRFASTKLRVAAEASHAVFDRYEREMGLEKLCLAMEDTEFMAVLNAEVHQLVVKMMREAGYEPIRKEGN